MRHLLSIFLPIIFFSLACIGAGTGVLRMFSRKHEEPPLTELVLAFLLGQCILGSLFLLLALASQFSKPMLFVITTPFSCLGLWHLYVIRKTVLVVVRAGIQAFTNAPHLWQFVAVGVTCIFIVGGAASIAGFLTVDAKAFYLTLPKVVASSHRLVPLTGYESFTSVGLLAEMQLAALFLLGMPGATPRLFCWITGLAGAAMLLAICRHAGLARRGQIIGLVIMATSTAVTLLWSQGKTDLFAAVYGLGGALYALGSWHESTRRQSIVLAGLFTGFALVAKLTYVVAFLPTIYILLFWRQIPQLWLVLYCGKGRMVALRQHLNEVSIFAVGAFLALLPHLVKNLFLFGTLINTYGEGHWFSAETTHHLLLTYPLVLIFGNYWAQYGNMSPLLLSFLPLLLLAPWLKKPWNGPVAAISVAAFAGLVAWVALFPAIPMPRYFLAPLLLLIVPAAWAAERWSRRDKVSSLGVSLATLAVLIIFLRVNSLPTLSDAFRYLFVEQTEKGLNHDEASSYSVYEAINKTADPGARVFLISYFRFWLRPDLIQTSNGAHDLNIVWDDKHPDKFWRQLHENGFTYLYAEDNASPAMKALNTVPDWVAVEPIYPKGQYGAAYRLIFRNAPGKVRMTTKEVSPGAWDVVPMSQPATSQL
jgi:hypothetical protein